MQTVKAIPQESAHPKAKSINPFIAGLKTLLGWAFSVKNRKFKIFISIVLPQIAVRPLHHQHGNQVTRHCEPSSSLVLPLQPQSYPYPAVRTTTLKIGVIFDLMDQLRERVHQENNRLRFPRSTRLFFAVHFHRYLLQIRSCSDKITSSWHRAQRLPSKKLRIFSRRKLTTTARTSHWWSRVDVGDFSMTYRAVYSSIGPLQSSAVWLWSTEDHAVTVDKPARICGASQTALRKSARIRVSSTERVKESEIWEILNYTYFRLCHLSLYTRITPGKPLWIQMWDILLDGLMRQENIS